ncbi:MAG: hypothetical protein WAN72_03310 [Candidatus Acidiferrales bacterium]
MVREQRKIKKFRRSRDNGTFALTTLQNPNLEVRSLHQLIAAAEQVPAEDAAGPPVRTIPGSSSSEVPPPEGHLSPEAAAPGHALAEAALPENAEPTPETSLESAESPEPQTRPRRNTPRRKFVRSRRRKPAKKPLHTLAPRVPRRELTDRERHERKCFICRHPNRAEIDDDILHWCNPRNITYKYNLGDYRCIYRHALATGLMDRRRTHMRDSLEHVIEHAESVKPSADAIIRAVRACGRLNAKGEWVDPPRQMVYSSESPRRVVSARLTLESSENLPQLPPAIDLQPAISNRQSQILENTVKHSKQTTAPSSNRHFFAVVTRKFRAFLDA